jgi:hypothetical protein
LKRARAVQSLSAHWERCPSGGLKVQPVAGDELLVEIRRAGDREAVADADFVGVANDPANAGRQVDDRFAVAVAVVCVTPLTSKIGVKNRK